MFVEVVALYLLNSIYYIFQTRFPSDLIHRACGTLDTNSYDHTLGNIRARALYKSIAYINHSCQPNCWKFFDSDGCMTVVAAVDIERGEEVTLNYTPILMSTPVRQVRI